MHQLRQTHRKLLAKRKAAQLQRQQMAMQSLQDCNWLVEIVLKRVTTRTLN
jgi:hypothetical protein